MEQLTLTVETRNTLGKGPARQLRRAGKLPAVLYGLGTHRGITVEPKMLHKLLLTEGGRNQVLSLKGDGLDGKYALVKDYQVDPVSRKLLHIDLIEIDVSKKILVVVTINITGKAQGVIDGGVLNLIARSLEVRSLPTNIPSHIDIDITGMNIGDAIHLDDVKFPEGVEKASALNPTLLTIVPPAKEEAAAASLAPSAEPEVITAKKPAEGEAVKKDEKKK